MHGRIRACLLVLTIIILNITSLSAEILPSVGGLYYYVPAATVSGADALWSNPAGLGKTSATGYMWMADYFDGKMAEDWGVVLHKKSVGIGYRSLERPEGKVREYRIGMGAHLGSKGSYFGFNYQYYKDAPPDLHKRHLWNVGILNQSNSQLAWGVVFSNLNRNHYAGERTEIEQRYSVAYRPKGDQVTLSAEMFIGTRTRLTNAEFVYHIETTPRDGVYLNGWIDSHKNFNLGFRVNLLKHFVGSQSSFDRHGSEMRTTAYYGATSQRQKSVIHEPGRRLALSLSGSVRENPPQPVIGRKATAFTTLIQSIYRAADDDSINELVLKLSSFSPGFGRAQELRNALTQFKQSGKRVICHLGRPGNLSYYIASLADSILIPPVSQFNLTGLRMELTFYKGLMDKLGIKAEMERIGDHKTAPERYTREAASPANQAQINRILDSFFDQFVTDIAESRGIDREELIELINHGPYSSTDALKLGLVDGLSYADDFTHALKQNMPLISFRSYQADTVQNSSWGQPGLIAVVPLEGEIELGAGGGLMSPATEATPSRMTWSLGKAASDPRVKGIVLRVDSPGGLALAGDEIYHQVDRAASKKPVVISVANIAASGGYYVATPGERIFVNPASITGSIGIYGGKPDLSGLYDKLSVNKEIYTRGDNAGWLSFSRPFTPEQREKYLTDLEAFYDHFVQLVAESRGLAADSVDRIAEGRVWTGREAVANGLADQEGGVLDAARFAAGLAGLENYEVAPYPISRPFFLWPQLARLPYLGDLFKTGESPLGSLLTNDEEESGPDLYTRLPFDFEVE